MSDEDAMRILTRMCVTQVVRVERFGEDVTRMLQECFEETAVVELRLKRV